MDYFLSPEAEAERGEVGWRWEREKAYPGVRDIVDLLRILCARVVGNIDAEQTRDTADFYFVGLLLFYYRLFILGAGFEGIKTLKTSDALLFLLLSPVTHSGSMSLMSLCTWTLVTG